MTGVSKELSVPLGSLTTVFQAELLAIGFACDMLADHVDKPHLVIQSDSTSALLALNNPLVTSLVVQEVIGKLDQLGTRTRLTLRWVQAHKGHRGNEIADSLAKKGTAVPFPDDTVIPVSECIRSAALESLFASVWKRRWDDPRTNPIIPTDKKICRQTRLFWPAPDPARTRLLLRFNREAFGFIVQILTGHNRFRRHMHLLGEADDPMCHWCSADKETSEHLVCHCQHDYLVRYRLEMLDVVQCNTDYVVHFDHLRVFDFILCIRTLFQAWAEGHPDHDYYGQVGRRINGYID
jgi:ribonuclease HI